ncbi:MAG: helix-turn-helix transcriptional regulator [Motiliproteus sp.]
MSQTAQLVLSLKLMLKAHGKTYADVAVHLKLSEASVKRLFSEQNFSLQRLEQTCQLMGMDISDLVQLMTDSHKSKLSGLTEEQEKEIAADLELLMITVCVLNRWTMTQILGYFQLEETSCIRHLAKLDRLKLIELLPKNRIKLLVAPNFKWLDNGPIQRFFQEKLEAEFFSSRFDKEHERLLVMNGMLADSSNAVFQRKMEQLVREFEELNTDDSQLPFDERKGTTVVIAVRQWQYGLFEKFKRKYR